MDEVTAIASGERKITYTDCHQTRVVNGSTTLIAQNGSHFGRGICIPALDPTGRDLELWQ